jgi:hypothetical protein
MRKQKSNDGSLDRQTDDLHDWYFIGVIALALALVIWLPLLAGLRF